MNFQRRVTWRNHLDNQSIQPLRLYQPQDLDGLVGIVREAERLHCTVRAVGSGHSWSDVALTPGFLVDTSALNLILDLEPDLLHPARRGERLVRTQAGIRLRELNAYLDSRDLALSNMGGYDAQTVAGVMSTSTHGSGLDFGPLAAQVRSFDMVAGKGKVFRIEPSDGLTDPAAFGARYPGWLLVQNDDWFNAAVVAMGSMGVIYAAILEVEPKYWLKEVRTLQSWPDVKADLQAGDILRRNRHYEFLFNPYAVNGVHQCLVTTRNPVPPPQGLPRDKMERHPLSEFFASLSITAKIMQVVFDRLPKLAPELINKFALEGLVDNNYTNVSYKVLNIGAANRLPAYSMEIGVALEGNRYIEAVERVMAVAAAHASVAEIYETGPVSVRFVRASPAYMSMMYGRDTAMLELIMLAGTEGGPELLGAYEDALDPLAGRPHWGQVNSLTGSDGQVRALYPRIDDWLAVRRQLDPAGTFDSPFTKRVGISRRGFPP
jgi:hypothetical protein